MRRIAAAALVLVPLALARAGEERPPAGQGTPPAAAQEGKRPGPVKEKATRPAEAGKGAAALPPGQGEPKKAEPVPCEEVKPCPID